MKAFIFAIAAMIAAIITPTASAAAACMVSTEFVYNQAQEDVSEELMFKFIDSYGHTVQLWVNTETGAATLSVIFAHDPARTCIVSQGNEAKIFQ